MNDLNIELAAFRSEMKEFKKTINCRIDSLDSRSLQCQINPGSCANARRLEEHIREDKGKSGKITGVVACIVSSASFFFVLVEKLWKN